MGKWLNLAKRAVSEALHPRVKLGGVASAARRSPNGFDPYAWRVRNALGEIIDPNYSNGMICFLESDYPRLFAELTKRLPADLERLWKRGAPLEEFECALTRWVQTHRQACALYQAHLSRIHRFFGPQPRVLPKATN